MVRVEVIAYTPTEFLEETDVAIGHCRELVEKYAVTWVNVVDPDGRTLEELETLFGFHPIALEDAQDQNLTPKVDVYDGLVLIVARTIVWAEEIETDQLSLFLGKKNIIDELEEKALENPSRETANTIHQFRRDLLVLRNALRPQRDAFTQLARTELPLFRRETREYLRDVYDHMIQTLDRLDMLREVSSGLMEVYLTVVNNNLNEVVKTLTIIATVMLPLSLIASIYGMNVVFPGREDVSGFVSALGLMAAVGVIMIIYFRRRKWF